MTDLDQLDIMRRAITALGLGQCAPEDLVAEARASASRREQDLTAKDALIAELRADLDTAQRQTVATKTWGEGYQNALRLYFDKMGLNGAGSLDDRMAHVAKICGAWAALTRICEVIGAPVPVCPDDAVDVVKTLHAAAESAQSRASQFEGDLRSIGFALNDAGAPTVYDMPDDSERPIPDLERIRILGGHLHTERGDRKQEALRAQRHADYLRDAHVELDYCGAPKLADGIAITPAARIRAYAAMVTAPTEDPSIALRQWTRDVWGKDDSL